MVAFLKCRAMLRHLLFLFKKCDFPVKALSVSQFQACLVQESWSFLSQPVFHFFPFRIPSLIHEMVSPSSTVLPEGDAPPFFEEFFSPFF